MATRKSTWIRALMLLSLLVVATAAFVGPLGRAPAKRTASERAPEVSPEGFVLVDARELLKRIKRTQANGTVVNAWASWCGSCKEELPMLVHLKQTFGDSIDILLVSVDDPDGRKAAARMIHDLGDPTPVFAVDGPLEPWKHAMNPRWSGVIPATFLFDPAAKLRYFWGGTVYENEITPLLRRYLAGEQVDGEAEFVLAPGAVTR